MAVVTIFSDASYCDRYKVAGYAFRVSCCRGLRKGSGSVLDGVPDNNVAEMLAVVKALDSAVESGMVCKGDSIIHYCDSQVAIKRLEQGVNARSCEAEKSLHKRLKTLSERYTLCIELRHMRGHGGYRGPHRASMSDCDILARQSMNQARRAKRGQQ
ncbi:Rnase H [Pseudomonas phage Knedl]|nr:Rnase H [Pseudomonas phage Knedl]